MSIKDRYKRIRDKYQLINDVKELLYVDTYAELWHQNTEDVCDGHVAIYGAGNNTDDLLKLLTLWGELQKVGYIIDNSRTGVHKGIQIINDEEIEEHCIELVWVSSFRYRSEMKNSMASNHSDVRCFEPCDHINAILNLDMPMDLSRIVGLNKYRWFANRLIERKIANDPNKVRELTRELIAGYYCICDWVDFRREIDAYLSFEYPDKDKYVNLLKETNMLIDELENCIRKKNDKDCFIFLIDALSIYDAERMHFFSEWKRNALEFTSYKNEYPTTRELVMSMFTGWRPFEDKTYKNRKICFDDSELLSYIRDNDIGIKFITENNRLIGNFEKISSYENKNEENCVISEVLFNGLCELADDSASQIVVAHTYTTIHPPHMTPNTMFIDYDKVSNAKEAHNSYFEQAITYTDEIVHFYTDILDKCRNVTQIVMGDHGIDIDMEYSYAVNPMPYPNKAAQWEMEIMSPEIAIKGESIGFGSEDRIVSSNQLVDILHYVVKGQDPRDYLSYKSVIPIEIVPGYDKNWLMVGVRSRNYYLAIAAAGCMSKEYMYLNLETDEDLYYRIEGKRMTLIEDEDEQRMVISSIGSSNIEQSRFPKDILDDEFFSEHNRIYQDKTIEWA